MPVRDSTPFTDDNPRPFVIPFCASCDMPAEQFTTYPDASPEFFLMEVRCHGKTEGVRVSRYEAAWAQRTGRRLRVFKRREGFDAVR